MKTHTRFFGLMVLAVLAAPALAMAAEINLSLNLIYDNPRDENSAGTWQVIAGADEFGIDSVAFAINNVNPVVSRQAPFGVVNGSDGAGFSSFIANPIGTTVLFALGHGAPPTSGDVGEFYGFGTLTNGAPDGPGAEPVGQNVVFGSPVISSLSSTSNIPWATGDVFGDAAFDTYATIATGTFNAGSTPEFSLAPSSLGGTVFTSLGTASTPGGVSLAASTTVNILDTRTNFIPLPDYNGDDVVSAADYTVFRDTFGATVTPGSGADGDGSGMIDAPDFVEWQNNFGGAITPAVAAAVSSVPVPEPAGLGLALLGLGLFFRGIGRDRR